MRRDHSAAQVDDQSGVEDEGREVTLKDIIDLCGMST